MDLAELGWNDFFEKEFTAYRSQGQRAARVTREDRHTYLMVSEDGEMRGELSGRLRHKLVSRNDRPVVGDWVTVHELQGMGRGIIRAILPRKSKFSRRVVEACTEEQVVAANVDTVFLMSGLDSEFNPRRIERYLVLAWDSGADPVIVLNKADLCKEIEECVGQLESLALGSPVLVVSAKESRGIDQLGTHLGTGKTVALLGSSGVGKSTLINALLGEDRQDVKPVREGDGKGRHTTSVRELIVLPQGGMIIDNPGMREIQIWAEEEGLEDAFEDIEKLAALCRFRDCQHLTEPGCAIKEAIIEGRLDAARFRSYVKLRKELAHLRDRQYVKSRLAEKAKWKKISQFSRERKKQKWSLS
jgi:ribosome biogenesis GTPase